MTSRKRPYRRFAESPSPDPTEATTNASVGGTSERRVASVYDAVAGRVTTTLPLNYTYSKEKRVKHHKWHAPDTTRDPVLAPEEALFKRVRAPVRYAEKDIYHAHENLPDGGRDILPDSDLLKSIHTYASHFYRDLSEKQGPIGKNGQVGISNRSMDETALLAFGMLLEEAGRETLGKDGDLVFTEGMEMTEGRGSHSDDDDVEVFGFMDAPRYEARARLKRGRQDPRENRDQDRDDDDAESQYQEDADDSLEDEDYA